MRGCFFYMSDKLETKEVRKRGYEGTRRYAYDVENTYKGMTKDEWRAMIVEEYEAVANKSTCEWLLFCFHDKDVDEQGLPKPLHVHFIVKFKAGRTTSAVMSDFCGTNPRVDNCKWVDARKGGYKSLARYMTHHSESAYNKRKTWYHHSDVYAYGIDYLELIKSGNAKKADTRDMKDSAEELLTTVAKGEMTKTMAVMEFEERHGSLAAVEYTSKFDIAEKNFAARKTEELKKRNLDGTWLRKTTFIYGPGESGKSRTALYMAEKYADNFGVHNVAGGGGRNITTDLVDGYKNEMSAVIDDVESASFSSREFFKMFDRDNWAISKSRNSNKPWFPEKVFMSTDEELGYFFIKLIFYSSTAYQKKTGDMKYFNADDLKGREELNGREQTIEQIRMIARRVQNYVKYDNLDDGTPVIRLFKLVDKLPKSDDVIQYSRERLNGKYDARIFDIFYHEVGYIIYNENTKNKPEFEDERRRISNILVSVIEDESKVKGFNYSYKTTLLSELRLEKEKHLRKLEVEADAERKRVMLLEDKVEKYEALKLREKEMELEKQENELLKKIMDKMPQGSLSNPFEVSAFLDELKKTVKPIVAQEDSETALADHADVIN